MPGLTLPTGSLIQTARADFRVRRNPQSLCHFGENGTDKLARFPNLGQILFVNAQIGKHFRPVFFRADIPVLRGCQQGTLADVLSGELIDDIILQQQDVPHLLPQLRLVFPYPQQLCRRPAGFKAHLTGHLVAQFVAEGRPQCFRLLTGPVIHPDDGIAQGLAVLVCQTEGLSLNGEADGIHLPGVHILLPDNLQTFPNGVHVYAAGSFHPCGVWRNQGILYHCIRLLAALLVKNSGFQGGGSNIDT